MSKKFKQQIETETMPPANCEGYYEVPSGYRKILGSYCDGGVDLGPKLVECPVKIEKSVKNATYIPLEEEEDVVDLDHLYVK